MPTSDSPISGARERRIGPVRLYRIAPPRVRRIAQVIPGLLLFGIAMGLAIEASLGVSPWTVFHQGVSERTGMSIGTVTVVTGVVLLFLYPRIDQPMGLGTFLNAIIIGPTIDATLWIVPDLESLPLRLLALVSAPIILGVASGLYIGAGLGPGPRDGLMTALERRGMRVGVARLTVESIALFVGWLLGGDVGLGTIWLVLAIPFFVDRFLRPPLRIDPVSSD